MLSTVLLYLAIPLTSGLIGWGTNVLAIEMMFRPLTYVGWKPLGWQGIIPSKARKMASICVDMMTTQLIDVQVLAKRIKPERVSEELHSLLERMTKEIVEDVISENYPRAWESIPKIVKEKTYARIHQEIPVVIERIVHDLQFNIKELFDIRTMVVDAFVRNRQLLNDLFLRCGGKEFLFIGRSGLIFGFLFGLIQMTIWIFFKPWWLLPLAGLLVGYATNWLALKMVFEPLEPKKVLGVEWQGLFLKRQEEVSHEYAAFFAQQILKPESMIQAILRGPASDQLFQMVHRHLKAAIDDASGYGKPFLQMAVGTQRYIDIKQSICNRILRRLPLSVSSLYDYTEEALDLENTLAEELKRLEAKEFEGILRPIFKEDEWILIVVGAILGALAGVGQLVFLFSG